jgi:ATP-binding cassette subfamily F protein uup
MDARRNQLIRKELAWLRRGAPAQTVKPKFRVDAANELISSEPAPRDKSELLKFALNRLGRTVLEYQHAKITAGDKELISELTWNIGPGDRFGIVGINGAGKTTLMRTMAAELEVAAGKLVTGITVKIACLTQHLDELDPTWRVLEAVENVANHIEIGKGRTLSASQLCERLGFDRPAPVPHSRLNMAHGHMHRTQCCLFPGIWVVNTTFGVFSGTGMRWYWYAWYF